MFCVVWTFSRCGGPTHTHTQGLACLILPPPPFSQSVSGTYTHSEGQAVCEWRILSRGERWREEHWGEERGKQQSLPCQGRENDLSAASLSVSGAGLLFFCSDCSLCMHRHTVSYRKLSLLSAARNIVVVLTSLFSETALLQLIRCVLLHHQAFKIFDQSWWSCTLKLVETDFLDWVYLKSVLCCGLSAYWEKLLME